ncbi:MAG TPA: NUDIX domain-containing protein [Streptosporangiaceae bacterium]
MKQRVRAVLITPHNTMLTIKRIRPDTPPYWVLPGGGVEDSDESLEAALHREIDEELAGKLKIIRLLHFLETATDQQFFYLATTSEWNFENHTGSEFSQEGRGEYLLEEVPLTPQALDQISLKPEEITAKIKTSILHGQCAVGTPG